MDKTPEHALAPLQRAVGYIPPDLDRCPVSIRVDQARAIIAAFKTMRLAVIWYFNPHHYTRIIKHTPEGIVCEVDGIIGIAETEPKAIIAAHELFKARFPKGYTND